MAQRLVHVGHRRGDSRGDHCRMQRDSGEQFQAEGANLRV
jgi:hypothetical protein